ncbi:methyl-accepting chemotaxis protein [Paenibacillus lentus]|uniref:Methyl-accepting chemotaxis protein n=1 Tax=Paenibacillus lentus TaxID=1338368 RepID=A0A3S8RYV3_9BACL|nr:methyl-accepting chemotaxis protein [Paenibacillus lentus]AZK48122.1 methyl-accepting chemotaxis protein [Paenibacillus lentus]
MLEIETIRALLNKIVGNFKVKLFISIGIILLIPPLVLGVLATKSARSGIQEQITHSATESIKLADSMINDLVQPKLHDAHIFAEKLQGNLLGEEMLAGTRSSFEQYADLHPETSLIYYGTKEGKSLIIPEPQGMTDFDPRERPWYEAAMKEPGKAVVSRPYLSADDNKEITISVSMATADGSGVFGIDLKLENIRETFSGIKVGKEGYAILLDGEQHVIVHPVSNAGEKASESAEQRMYESDYGEYTFVSEGEHKYMTYITNALTGWKIGGTIYLSEIDDATKPIIYNTLLTGIVCLLVGFVFIYFMIQSIIKPIRRLKEQAQSVSEGDLTQVIQVNSNDEIGDLAAAFQIMQQKLRSLIGKVGEGAERVARSSGELTSSSEQTAETSHHIAQAVQEIAGGAERQTLGLEQNAAALDEIARGVMLIAERTNAVAELAKHSSAQAEEGSRSVEQAGNQMGSIYQSVEQSNGMIRSLYDRTREIGEITKLIGDVAGQTNLLALNAAIEAARAGEHGSGFAVVANEVRKLAEQSEQSALQINTLLDGIQRDAEDSVQTMTRVTSEVEEGLNISVTTMQRLEQAMGGIRETTPQIAEIAATAQQISASVQQIVATANELSMIATGNASAAQEVAASSEEQLAAMEQISASAQALSEMAVELEETIGHFKY